MRIFAIAVLMATTLLAQPANLVGTWTGQAFSQATEPFPFTAVFKLDGKVLSGHTFDETGRQVVLQDLELQGEKLEFWFEGPMGFELTFAGAVSRSEIKGTLKAVEIGITFDVTLTKKS